MTLGSLLGGPKTPLLWSSLDLWTLFGLVAVLVLAILWRRRLRGSGPGRGLSSTPLADLVTGLNKTRSRFGMALKRALGAEPTAETIDDLETALLEADMGIETTEQMMAALRTAFRQGKARSTDAMLSHLRLELGKRLQGEAALGVADTGPSVILVVGVNGVGKTTSIAKLTHLLKTKSNSVLLCAADTFRAAAVDQLRMWSERLEVDIVCGQLGGDAAATVHDAVDAAIAREVDYLIVDTAGRLHTHKNLMGELSKIVRVIRKHIPSAPHEVLLVLDATTGQNAIEQARIFQDTVDVTGIFLSKLDGTAKGGIVVAIYDQLGIPVKLIGLGEQHTDVQPFEAKRFIAALFEPS